ncbi:MAG: sphingomyelin phosphodiesterase [Shewanella sp.]|nr:sphingomyelin phosphodiesterase [Shewanella sp.]
MKKLLTCVLLLCLQNIAWATSYVYVTNDTDHAIKLETKVHGDTTLTPGNEYQQLAFSVPPRASRQILRLNRDEGIKAGKTYDFDTEVTGLPNKIILRQKLKGRTTFSDIWQSGIVDGTEMPWFTDRAVHQQSFQSDKKAGVFAFQAQASRVDGDDIYYVIHDQVVNPTSQGNDNLKVLTYNTWALLPGIISSYTGERLNAMVDAVKGYDVIVFEELFDNSLRSDFLNHIAKEYPYHTKKLDRSGEPLNGGVVIVSRWPIESEEQVVYDDCQGVDCFAAKGVVYARINKNGSIYNVFGTHPQADDSAKDKEVRANQIIQFKSFVDSLNIPAKEPVLFAGDFNIDKIHYPGEYKALLNVLNATEPQASGLYTYSFNPELNHWATGEQGYLDYVLYSNEHVKPITSTNTLRIIRSIDSSLFGLWDLSDHFPVEGDFTYSKGANGN